MSKLLRLTAKEAEKLLLKAGFKLIRSKGSHRIYAKEDIRFILPYHTRKVLHPKIVKQLFYIINQKQDS